MTKVFVFVLFVLCVSCKPEIKKNQFTLNGNYKGNNVDFLILSYFSKAEIFIVDTLNINSGKFKTKGNIDGATLASIEGNVKSNSVSDVNFTDFFLEPKNLSVSLTENAFKEKKVVGSLTQQEYENLEKKTAPIDADIKPLMDERNKLMENIGDIDSLAVNLRLGKISEEWTKNLNKIRSLRLKYVTEHPKSDLSAYWLKFYFYYFRELPLDSVEVYFNNLDIDVKNNLYGKIVKRNIEIYKNAIGSNVGDKAFDFELKNQNNKDIILNSFKGKYVLLDFWASWCKPCREENPNLKSLYQTYHPKGLEIIGVSGDTDEGSWIKARKNDGIDGWHHVRPGDKRVFINAQFDIKSYPTYILIDKKGYIVNRYREISEHNLGMDDLRNEFEEIFNKTP